MIKAQLAGMLWFRLSDLSDEQVLLIRDRYSYPHPHDQFSIFETYLIKGTNIGVPSGDLQKLHDIIGDYSVESKQVATPVDNPITATTVLHDYQLKATAEISAYFACGGTAFNLAGRPGSGKTFTLAHVLAELGVKTLILAHLSMLTDQIAAELSANTNAKISVLSASNKELSDINIATSQFISQNPDLWKEIKHKIGCIVVDEAESLGSITTMRIVQRAHAKYRIFISATFARPVDARTKALRDFAGYETIVLDNPNLMRPTILMVQCSEQYPKFLSKSRFVRDKQKFFRQESILLKAELLAKASIAKGRQVLIATDIIEMQNELAQRLNAEILNSETKKKDRDAILQRFDEGTTQVLCAAAVVNAGLSIPKITTIIRISFPSSSTKSVQLVGRALRMFDGKEGAWLFDLVFAGQNPTKRIDAYRKEGWTPKVITWDNLQKGLNL